MSTLFGDEEHAKLYVRYRPQYPIHLYDRMLKYLDDDGQQVKCHKLAVDVGCGSGQNTCKLAEYFDEVIGVDTSEAQLEEARKASSDHSNVHYQCGSANDLKFLKDNSVDLVTAATALHWFDVEGFYAECMRILRPGGIVAAFCYASPTLDNPEANEIVLQFFVETMIDHLAPQIVQHVFNRYDELFSMLQKTFQHSERDDSFEIKLTINIKELCGFLSTSSPYQRYIQEKPDSPDPLIEIAKKLKDIYSTQSEDDRIVTGCFHIFMLLGKKLLKSSSL